MPSFLTLCQTVREEAGAAGTGPASVSAQTGEYKRIVNSVIKAERWVRKRWQNWKFLWAQGGIPIVAPSASYDLPNGIARLDRTSLPDTMTYMEWKDFRALDSDADPGDIAVVSIAPNGRLHVWPTPASDSTLTLEGWINGTDLADNTDVSPVPEDYHRAIVLKALMLYSDYEEEGERGKTTREELAEWMKLLEGDQLPIEDAAVGMGQEYGDLRVEVV